ncbi:MAG: c-type cytochrome, partial [Acidobacteria bacterium]|nr:c-type cytochrome [Acidobacteriota bacterium]MDW7984814.1 c-type cytochrome [Acidobacteriota bacterium]
ASMRIVWWSGVVLIGWIGLSSRDHMSSVPAVAPSFASASVPEEGHPCMGILQDPEAFQAVLRAVSRYKTTYVVLYSDDLGVSIESVEDPILLSLRVGVPAGTPAADLAQKYRLLRRVDFPSTPTALRQIVTDVLARKIDAALLWAPLAGLLAMELDPSHRLSMMPLAAPTPPPASFASSDSSAVSETVARCRDEVQGTLEAYGVVPAEVLAPPNPVEELPASPEPPPENIEEARQGWDVYQTHCERCHGPDAISGGLAPDLRDRVRRLTYAEFFQIVLQGRVEKGMPAWRGLLKPDDVRLVYQYIRARSTERLGPGRPS